MYVYVGDVKKMLNQNILQSYDYLGSFDIRLAYITLQILIGLTHVIRTIILNNATGVKIIARSSGENLNIIGG